MAWWVAWRIIKEVQPRRTYTRYTSFEDVEGVLRTRWETVYLCQRDPDLWNVCWRNKSLQKQAKRTPCINHIHCLSLPDTAVLLALPTWENFLSWYCSGTTWTISWADKLGSTSNCYSTTSLMESRSASLTNTSPQRWKSHQSCITTISSQYTCITKIPWISKCHCQLLLLFLSFDKGTCTKRWLIKVASAQHFSTRKMGIFCTRCSNGERPSKYFQNKRCALISLGSSRVLGHCELSRGRLHA